jgi:hypothetical protein
MVILDLWGISFHPAVVVGLGNDLLFNSILAHCEKVQAKKFKKWTLKSGSIIVLSRIFGS